MSKRRQARRAAAQLLYQAEIWGGAELPLDDVNTCLENWEKDSSPDEATRQFAMEVVYGVAEHVAELDEIIDQYAEDWTLERMPVIDKNVLRLALYELLHRDDIPWQVSVNEAVELAKRYSTPECAGFVNGVLVAVQQGRPPGETTEQDEEGDG
ncbi:MAG: transcription antitermination factor NusB [Armatimonadia bacterium]|nr:transcription antitermination factor NusB [Armatimonadia bacterium]